MKKFLTIAAIALLSACAASQGTQTATATGGQQHVTLDSVQQTVNNIAQAKADYKTMASAPSTGNIWQTAATSPMNPYAGDINQMKTTYQTAKSIITE